MRAMSTVLIREEVKVQQPIYFISHALSAAVLKYLIVEKVAYSVLLASRKLWPYFDAHQIIVLTNQPWGRALHNFEASGQLLKWAIKLSQYDIQYKQQRRNHVPGTQRLPCWMFIYGRRSIWWMSVDHPWRWLIVSPRLLGGTNDDFTRKRCAWARSKI